MDQYIIILIAGLWLLGNSLALKTKNFQSSLLFKIIPFFLGLALTLISVKYFWF